MVECGWLTTLLALHWSALLTPGANVLLVSHLAASGQRRAAVAAALGITAVAGLWAALATVGVDAVLRALPGLTTALQAAGAVYLAHLAWKMWRAAAAPSQAALTATPASAFRTGVATNLTNPKSVYFFIGIFLAIRADLTTLRSQALAVAVVAVDAFAWHLLIALVFSRPAVSRFHARHAAALGRGAAILLAVVSVRLLVQLAA